MQFKIRIAFYNWSYYCSIMFRGILQNSLQFQTRTPPSRYLAGLYLFEVWHAFYLLLCSSDPYTHLLNAHYCSIFNRPMVILFSVIHILTWALTWKCNVFDSETRVCDLHMLWIDLGLQRDIERQQHTLTHTWRIKINTTHITQCNMYASFHLCLPLCQELLRLECFAHTMQHGECYLFHW